MIRTTLILLSLVLSFSGLATPAAAAGDKPHVLVILVDDMGYGDVGCYNPASKIPTPHIDTLAKDGMRFTDAHAAGPLCHVSRYGLLTGRHPFRSNCGAWSKGPVIDKDRMTIASLLDDADYHTAMVGKWHLGFNENGYDKPLLGGPVDRGFDSFFGIRASTDIPPYFYIRDRQAVAPPTERIQANHSEGWSPIQGAFWRAGGIAPGLELEEVTPRLTEQAIAVIEQHAQRNNERSSDQPLMLYLAYPSPHTPWLPSERFEGKSGAGMYGDFLMMVDEHIGRVLAALEKSGMANETLVIFSSDNGPVWYDKDVRRFGHDSAAGLRGMKADAWEAGHRMPFIARWPGTVKPGSVSDQMICFTDVLATLADLVGRDLPENAGVDSFSFFKTLTGEQAKHVPIRKYLAVPSGGGRMTIRRGPWKLIDGLGSGGFSKPRRVKPESGEPPMQLYNLAEDLAETKNLYAEQPEIVKELLAELERIRRVKKTR